MALSIEKSAKQKYLDLEFWFHRWKLARKKGHFSNFGEQEIIEKYIDRLSIAEQSKTIVDIGAGNGTRMSNTFALFAKGWNGVGIEYDCRLAAKLANIYKFYPNVSACRCMVTPMNVVSLLEGYSIEPNFGILSLDIDSYDLAVLDALLAKFRPRLVVTEINEKIPPPIRFSVNFDPDFKVLHHFYGYSLASLESVLTRHNYLILELEYNNVFLAPAELAGDIGIGIEQAYREGYLERADRKEKFRLNEGMEVLHSLTPEAGIEFLDHFYSKSRGKYEIGLD
ncbi:MAG: hypothetical protein IPK58_03845 [Acidobacteria bacterium]|nr:hypothetical protein [Acidobacteriota bacterium]